MQRSLMVGLMAVAAGLAGSAAAQAPAKVGATGLGLPISCPQTLTMSSESVPPIFSPVQQLYILARAELGGGKARCVYLNNNTGAEMPLEANAPNCQPLVPQNWSSMFASQGSIACTRGAVCTFRCN
ncbi:hypothetical protein [Phenylobacterium sp.]|uniref:hypothetical protein n=1 Tax=Phenylobacterium sp. TaxID=1871053 RepID=UPI003918A212